MTIDSLTTPFGPLAKVALFGHPFHGPVSASQLTLPNSTTRAYLQPSSADAWAVTLAGVPAVERSETEAAADAAAGHQWLQQLVVSGAAAQVYGKRLTGELPAWVWRDANGVCWQFSLPTLSTYQTSIRVRARKFGRIGEPISTATDTDLTHAVDDGAIALSLATTTNTELTNTVLRICDINADGSKVILGLFARPPRTSYDVRFGANYVLPAPVDSALGFLLIEATTGTPTPTLSLTTLRNHRATLGTVAGTNARVPAGDWADLPPHPDEPLDVIGAVTFTTTVSVSDRVVSMYFGLSDAPKEFTIGYSASEELVRNFDRFYIDVPGYPGQFFRMKDTQSIRDVSFSLSRDGTQVASVVVPHIPYAESISLDGLTVSKYYEGGTYHYWFRGDYPPISPVSSPTESDLLPLSRDRTQNGLWLYSKKLVGLFSISHSGLVTWTACFSPDATAAAQTPATGTWASDGGFGSNRLFGGPSTWWRALDPLTGAISTAYSAPVCYV